MRKLQIPTTVSSNSRKLLSALLVALATASLLGAGVAQADKKQGNGGASGCQVENNGKLETVPVGTKVGLFTCGEDGEWHFGWLINAISARPKGMANPSGTGTGHGVGAVRDGVLHVSRAAR